MLNFSINELNKKLKNKEITAEQLVHQFLQRIQDTNAELSSLLEVYQEDALVQARQIDKTGDFSNPLTGIPYVNKALINYQGKKTTAASQILQDYQSVEDATVIQKLKDNQAICLGSANLDEFAQGSSTEYSSFTPTKNP